MSATSIQSDLKVLRGRVHQCRIGIGPHDFGQSLRQRNVLSVPFATICPVLMFCEEVFMLHPQLGDPDLPLDTIMKHWPETIIVFSRHKMLCIGCVVGPFHTVTDACAEYGLNVDVFLAELAESIKQRTLKA